MLKRASPLHYYLYFAMTFLKMRPSILQRTFLDVLFLAVTGSKCWPGEFGQSFVEKQAQLEGGGGGGYLCICTLLHPENSFQWIVRPLLAFSPCPLLKPAAMVTTSLLEVHLI